MYLHPASCLLESDPKFVHCHIRYVPFTYFRFSSSFICSARSRVPGKLAIISPDEAVGFGVPLADVCAEAPITFKGDIA